jgi:hypothetical protein
MGEGGAWVRVTEAIRDGIGVRVGRTNVGVAVGEVEGRVGEGEVVTVIVEVGTIVIGAWTASAPHAAIKNAARVNRTPAAELDLTNRLLFIRGGMIALNEVDVQ